MTPSRAPRSRMRLAAALAVAMALPSQALAAPSDKAAAQVLFDDAMKLVGKKQYGEACPKLEESLQLDPQMGTKYRLAECYEKTGRTASAWGLYREIADEAKAAGLADREKKARERIAKLEPTLARLTISVDPANGTALKIMRDGAEVGAGQLGSAVPVNPGPHKLEASAPGKSPWSTTIEVAEKTTMVVTVPVLQPLPPVDKPPEPPPKPIEQHWGTQKTVGLVTVGVGVVSLGLSTVLIMSAKGMVSDAAPRCDGNACDPAGLELRESARSRGNLATLFFGVGVVAMATGGVLFFTGTPTTTTVGVGPGTLIVGGRF